MPNGADIEDVKKSYRKIALNNHPDKIQHCDYTEEEKKMKEETFRKATKAYQSLLNGQVFYDDDDKGYIDTQYMDMFANTFSDIASKVFDYYQSNAKTVHDVTVSCSYSEMVAGSKKRCSVKLYSTPVSFVVSCDRYPKTTVFEEVNGIEHEFIVHFKLTAHTNKSIKYMENGNGSVSIHLVIPISLYEYIQGSNRQFSLFEHDYHIEIPAFNKKVIILDEKNISGNTINCHIKLSLPTKSQIKTLSHDNYNRFLEILKELSET